MALLLVVGGCGDSSEGPPPPEAGNPAPRFDAELLAGGTFSLDEMIGRPIILNFWASWCEPCKREMPLLAEAAHDPHHPDLVVVGVNLGESAADAQGFLDDLDFEVPFPIVLDGGERVGALYQVPGLPTTYFIDRDGIVRYRRLGEVEEAHLTEGLTRTS